MSGKISILKPVQYKEIKISYHDYLKYLNNLFANDELYFALKVVELNNKTYFKFHNLEYIREDINNFQENLIENAEGIIHNGENNHLDAQCDDDIVIINCVDCNYGHYICDDAR